MKILPASQFKPDTPGIYIGLPMSVYQSAPGLSKSKAEVLRRSPMDFFRMECGQLKREETEALEHGTIYHSIVFEDKREFHIQPKTYKAPESTKKGAPIIDKPWNNNANACRDWCAQHADKPILSDYDAGEIERSAKFLREHPLAGPLISRPGYVEVSFFARHPEFGFMLKGRADKLWQESDGTIVCPDLKTTVDASTREFSKQIHDRGYHRQAAQYRLILRILGLTAPFEFIPIALEKGTAPKCNVRRLTEEAIDQGERENEDAFSLYQMCKERCVWPDFHDSEPQIGEIDLPAYAQTGRDPELTGMTEADAA